MTLRRRAVLSKALLALTPALYAGIAVAQIDLSGTWNLQDFQDYQIRLPGPNYADYTGIPLNANGRGAALGYSAESITQYDRSCQPWSIHYLFLGPFDLSMWSTLDPATGAVVAWNIGPWIDRLSTTIWMDGRAAPSPLAVHTAAGFTTGRWEGDTLVTHTTHIADGYLTRNGVPSSNQETLTMFITRHGDLLTITGTVRDPVYLTAPYWLARTWKYNPKTTTGFGGVPIAQPMNCMPEEEVPGLSDGYHVATTLPGDDHLLKLVMQGYHLPQDALLGGAKTMYPEYTEQLHSYSAPAECTRDCCGWGNGNGVGGAAAAARLQCKGGNF